MALSMIAAPRAVSLAMGDLAAPQAGAILRRVCDAAARVKNGDDEGFQFLLNALGEGDIADLADNFEREFSHASGPLRQGANKSWIARCRGSWLGRLRH
jgi:hypothetical protein